MLTHHDVQRLTDPKDALDCAQRMAATAPRITRLLRKTRGTWAEFRQARRLAPAAVIVSREKRRSARSPAAAAAVLPTCRIAQINWYRPESFATPDVTSRQTAANPRAAAFFRQRVRLTPRPPSRAVSPSPGAKTARAASRSRQAGLTTRHPPRSTDRRTRCLRALAPNDDRGLRHVRSSRHADRGERQVVLQRIETCSSGSDGPVFLTYRQYTATLA